MRYFPLLPARAGVGQDENVFIGDFILGNGDALKKVIVRTIGPSLATAGITLCFGGPEPTVDRVNREILAANDDWTASGHAREIVDTKLPPNDPKEFALVATLAPGACTAIETGVGAGCYYR